MKLDMEMRLERGRRYEFSHETGEPRFRDIGVFEKAGERPQLDPPIHRSALGARISSLRRDGGLKSQSMKTANLMCAMSAWE